jgi:putative PIN family toxin of toxin-antitoxin system
VRVVLDTGVVVSSLLFPEGRLGWVHERWVGGSVTPLVSRKTVEELLRVLAYPKFQLEREEIEVVLAAYLPFCETVGGRGRAVPWLPQCDDPHDQPFLELAARGRADFLVSGDRDLLCLRGQTPFEIVTAAELAVRLGGSTPSTPPRTSRA